MIVVTGATGRTGRRVAERLLAEGEKVRAVGRNVERLAPLVERGAEASLGNVEDANFLARTFAGATAVYLVLPEDISQQDFRAHQERVSDAYAGAVAKTHVPYAVNLSSIGAQHEHGTGPIVGLHNQEQKLNQIDGLNVLHVRAAYFMENLFMNMVPLRVSGTLPGAMPGGVRMPWIATCDIGDYAAGCLVARNFSGSSVQELHGQRDISMSEAALIVGEAIRRPDVHYEQLPGPALAGMLSEMGLPKKSVEALLEMWDGANKGLIVPQEPRTAENTTATSLETFVKETFAPVYLHGG